jgi:hypothetical protein
MGNRKHNTDQIGSANKAECPNVSTSEGRGVSMDAKRTQRLCDVLYRLHLNVHSLNAAAATFDRAEPSKENACPRTTVRAFTRPMDEDIDLIFAILDDAEPRQADEEGGA